MNDVKKQLELVENVAPYDQAKFMNETVKLFSLIVKKLDEIPYWVWENRCCPPGETCCDCD